MDPPIAHFNVVAVTDAGTFTPSHTDVLTVVQTYNDAPCGTTVILWTTGLPAWHTGSHGRADHDARRAATGIDLPDILHHAATLATTAPLTIPLVDRAAWPVGAASQGDAYG